MRIAIIQTSLNPDSKTEIVCKKALEIGKELKDIEVELINLKDYNLEFCDGRDIDKYNSDMVKIKDILETCDSFIIGYPIYNYSFSGVCKNFIDVFSRCMDSKTVGIINNSSGIRSSNEGIGELMKVLALHNKITVIQPVIHTFRDDFNEENIDSDVSKRIYELFDNLLNH